MSDTLLTVTDLAREYPTPAEPLVILDGVNFSLARAESMSIVGPSGSGKSTLLHIIGSLDSPTRGSVELDGQDPFTLSAGEQADFRNRKIGFVFQDHHLLPQCTVLENVLVPALVDPTAGADRETRARDLLDRVGLSARLDHRPAELSGGERQRVAVARAMINKPLLLLCDEPTGNLDEKTGESVAELFHQLQRDEETSLIIVTHSTALASQFDRKFALREGQLHEK